MVVGATEIGAAATMDAVADAAAEAAEEEKDDS
jgi:hypothetical protein